MKKIEPHRLYSEIRAGSNIATSLDISECIVADYNNLFSDAQAEKIRIAYSTLGFLAVRMPQQFIDDLSYLHETNKLFFDLSIKIKNSIGQSSIHQPNYSNIGYFPFDLEKAQSHNFPDRKEFLHIGRSPFSSKESIKLYAEIPWPAELQEIASKYRRYYDLFVSYAERIFLAIAQAYDIDEKYCKKLIVNGNSVLRNIHYPPIEENSNSMRAAPHHGMNLIGVQIRSTHPGLQFCTHSEKWVYLHKWPSNIVTVNAGRMLAYILNGRVKPTLHRVVNKLDRSNYEHRYTSVLFFHGNPSAVLKPMLGNGDMPDITIGEWTSKRLQDIRLK